MSLDVSSIAHRVARAILAERGGSGIPRVPPGPSCVPAAASAPSPAPSPAAGGRPLVTADCLARVPDGGRFQIPPGAQVTPLARDEAWQRRIELVEAETGGAQR